MTRSGNVQPTLDRDEHNDVLTAKQTAIRALDGGASPVTVTSTVTGSVNALDVRDISASSSVKPGSTATLREVEIGVGTAHVQLLPANANRIDASIQHRLGQVSRVLLSPTSMASGGTDAPIQLAAGSVWKDDWTGEWWGVSSTATLTVYVWEREA